LAVIYHHKVTIPELPENATAEMHLLCVEVEDVHKHASDLISELNDTSWISQLNPIGKMSYERTAHRTISALVEMFSHIESHITEEFGEYMVSMSATNSMKEKLSHSIFPLSELWKEKKLGNHGFDFHTESISKQIAFGEAKYNRRDNSYTDAAIQVLEFIKDGKDYGDAVHLTNFASPGAILNLQNKRRGFAVAFSLHSNDHVKILNNALNSALILELSSQCHELYIIGVRS